MTLIITGTSQGLGSHLVELLAPKAERVIAINRRSTGVQEEILCDLSSQDSVELAGGDLQMKLTEKADVLFVLNAGDFGNDEVASDVLPTALGKLMYVNVFSQLVLVEGLVKAGHKVRLLAISSGMGSIAQADEPFHYAYCASKAALNLCVRLLRQQHPNLDYLLIDPGWMQTQMGGEDATVDPSNSAAFIAKVVDDPTKWNDATGMLSAVSGEIVPW